MKVMLLSKYKGRNEVGTRRDEVKLTKEMDGKGAGCKVNILKEKCEMKVEM